MRGRSWAWVGLGAVVVFDVWWRCHTVGPTLRDRLGLDLYPVSGVESEPLDCDEAIYAYIGKRIDAGDVMYRDLTENKPPLGYWIFALAVAIGGATELTVRLMPIPVVLATTVIVWWLGLRLRGPGAAVLAALTYAVVSTDPFLYGNGNQMEQMINLAATASLALVVSAWERPGPARLFAAGACLGAAALVKQVAALNGPVFAAALLLRGTVRTGAGVTRRGVAERAKDVLTLTAGFVSVCAVAALIVITQGAGREAFDDVFRYGPALATDVPAEPHTPPLIVRWFTGNADPKGQLPWPFGRTDYLVWWGSGSWPVWLAAVPGLVWLVVGKSSDPVRRLLAVWTLSAWIQVALPRLFWQHYYLLPVPGLAMVVAVFFADMVTLASRRRVLGILVTTLLAAALACTARLQVVEYLQVAPEQLTVRDKGGAQWVALRAMGRDLARRSSVWARPTLFVWGWQSPLFFYSGLDGVTRQVFADDLVKTFAEGNHTLIRPRIERTMNDLAADPPALIFAGYPPFPALRRFLEDHYLPSHLVPRSPDGRGLWVERGKFGAFETNESPATTTRPRPPERPRR